MEKKRAVNLMAVVVVVCTAGLAHAAPPITSTFDTDLDGWWVTELSPSGTTVSGHWIAYWSAADGLPGGCIYTPDVGSGGTSFAAPSKFLGDKTDYFGGTISFDMRNNVANYEGGATSYSIWLFGGGIMLTHRGAYPTVPYQWVHDDAALDFQSWTYAVGDLTTPVTSDDFSTVLGNLEGMYIQTDWGWGPDTGWLDNVAMAQNTVPIPVPGAVWLLGCGLACLAGKRGINPRP